MRLCVVMMAAVGLASGAPAATGGAVATTMPAETVRIMVQPAEVGAEFQGMGCGVQFYEAHITSLAVRRRDEKQQRLYDDMFARVPTRYLHLGIRPDHEANDAGIDPWNPAFDPNGFGYCRHLIAIAKAARQRRGDMELLATLGTPPAWMKTNNSINGGGKAKGTLKPGLELRFAAYIWGFLAHMARNGVPVKYVSIANECDWAHEQPGCYFTPEAYADLFAAVGDYLEKMAAKFPDVPRAILVGPNSLGAPGAVKSYIPAMMRKSPQYVRVLAAHDYDPRGDRWGDMRRLAGERPVWMTEWCARDVDESPGQIRNATEYARYMHEAFTGGANVWMAYDWVYPPRKSGEGLIHVNWGSDYTLLKPYWVFRQWCTPLVPGMHLVRASAGIDRKTPEPAKTAGRKTADTAGRDGGVKPTAFQAKDGQSLVLHVVNTSQADVPVVLEIKGLAKLKSADRWRTSATQDMEQLSPLAPAGSGYADVLPGLSMTTYRLDLK